MSKKNNVRSRYIQIMDTLYNSIAFKTLPGPAMKLWFDLRTQFKGFNNGRIVCTLSRLRLRGWNSYDTLQRARDELLNRGLIKYTKRYRANAYRLASMFAFTDLPTSASDEHEIAGADAIHEYLRWEPPATAPRKKSPNRIPVQHATVARCSTAPPDGKWNLQTTPSDGEQENEPEAAPLLALRPIGDQPLRSPAHGDIYSVTR